jgi:hypothetical protein
MQWRGLPISIRALIPARSSDSTFVVKHIPQPMACKGKFSYINTLMFAKVFAVLFKISRLHKLSFRGQVAVHTYHFSFISLKSTRPS